MLGNVGGGGNSASGADQDKRRRTAAMGKAGLQGYLTSAQDALLRGFWQVGVFCLIPRPGFASNLGSPGFPVRIIRRDLFCLHLSSTIFGCDWYRRRTPKRGTEKYITGQKFPVIRSAFGDSGERDRGKREERGERMSCHRDACSRSPDASLRVSDTPTFSVVRGPAYDAFGTSLSSVPVRSPSISPLRCIRIQRTV